MSPSTTMRRAPGAGEIFFNRVGVIRFVDQFIFAVQCGEAVTCAAARCRLVHYEGGGGLVEWCAGGDGGGQGRDTVERPMFAA